MATDTEYVNAERLRNGRSCLHSGCGGYLRSTPFNEGYTCTTCKTNFQGK